MKDIFRGELVRVTARNQMSCFKEEVRWQNHSEFCTSGR